MQIHPFAWAAAGIHPDHPFDHNVNVTRLNEPLLSVAMAAADAGNLSCFTAFGQQMWVSRVQLAAVAGFGRKLYDPVDSYFVPPDAILRVPYLKEPVTAASPAYQQRHLIIARHAADYLAALHSVMPPRPFDLHIAGTFAAGLPLQQWIDAEQIRTYPSLYGRWVISAQVIPLVPDGECLDDPLSVWYVGPGDRADQNEVQRLTDEHRHHWPEIYGDAARASIRGASL